MGKISVSAQAIRRADMTRLAVEVTGGKTFAVSGLPQDSFTVWDLQNDAPNTTKFVISNFWEVSSAGGPQLFGLYTMDIWTSSYHPSGFIAVEVNFASAPGINTTSHANCLAVVFDATGQFAPQT